MMKKKKLHRQTGFTLIETMVTMSLFFVILFSVYEMVRHYGEVSKTEHARMTLQQESRYMVSAFADEIKEAGAVISLAFTPTFLSAPAFFYGIYPLNSTYFPDGIILAAGDPEAVSKLTADFAPGETVLNVENADVPSYDPSFPYENPQWAGGDRGIVIGTTGYYVFSVVSANTGGNTITIRDTPVYYSGLLATGYYYDDALGNGAGNTLTYSVNSPVIRLSNFSIYVFREVDHPKLVDEYNYPQKIRQMIRITDTYGESDPLDGTTAGEYSVISENIWDMQISYKAYANFAAASRGETPVEADNIYFAQDSSYTDPYTALNALMADIRKMAIKQVDVSIIAIADELGGKGELNTGEIPPLGDNTYNDLPQRKMNYRLFSFSVNPRNFSILFAEY